MAVLLADEVQSNNLTGLTAGLEIGKLYKCRKHKTISDIH